MGDHKALVQRLFDQVWVAGRPPDELLTDTYEADAPGMRGLQGAAGLTQLVTSYRTGFPDLTVTVDVHLADGDRVVTEFTLAGRHTGNWDGVRATRQSMSIPGCVFTHIDQDRITRQWHEWDRRRLLEQLNVMPRV